jgi:two-component system, chemotaxis family, sensor kinase CheA
MFIEDEELRSLYQAASADHLNGIETGLLHLEKRPDDRSQLNALLRATHSLKGDSRMLGVLDAETIVHQMEEVLISVDKGEASFSGQLCDRLYTGLDALRRIAQEATTGEPANVSVFHIVAQLMGAMEAVEAVEVVEASSVERIEQPTSTLESADVLANVEEAISELLDAKATFIPTQLPEPLKLEREEQSSEEQYSIDTIRVKAQNLDTLMTQADELAVTRLRIAQRVEDMSALLNLWEDWSRDVARLQRVQKIADPQEVLQQYQHLNHQRLQQMGTLLTQVRTQSVEDTARLETVAVDLESGLRNLRRLPLSSVFSLFPRMVRDLGKQQGKEIQFELEGGDVLADKRILEDLKDPLTHLLRNAIDHGLEPPAERLVAGKPVTATLRLRGYSMGDRIAIEVLDDGRGLDVDAIARTAIRRGLYTEMELATMPPSQIRGLIFAPGFSTRTTVTELSGRGVGLDVVKTNIERLKGTIEVESNPGNGCAFRLELSNNLASTQALILEVDQTPYALSLDAIETLKLVSREELFPLEGQLSLEWEGKPVAVTWLADILELPAQAPRSGQSLQTLQTKIPCVLLRQGPDYLGILVDNFLDQQQIVIKPHSKLLKRVRNLMGSTILASGEVCMVLNPSDLLKSSGIRNEFSHRILVDAPSAKPKVLLVEDSIPIRTQMKRILESAGYDVTATVDGLDGLNTLRDGQFDVIVSDVEMPNLTGLELTRQVRTFAEYEALPIILVTTLAKEEDKRKGTEAGANAYITKGDFDQSLLLNTLRRLI